MVKLRLEGRNGEQRTEALEEESKGQVPEAKMHSPHP